MVGIIIEERKSVQEIYLYGTLHADGESTLAL